MTQWMVVNRRWLALGCRILLWLSSVSLSICLMGTVGGMAGYAQTAAANRGYELLERGWVNDAIDAFRRALQQDANDLSARLGLAIAYQRAGQDDNAWQTYQQVLAQAPNNSTALAGVGLLGGYRPEWQAQGIQALNALIELEPDNSEARAQRALLLSYQGRFGEALMDYERLLATAPSTSVLIGAAQAYTYSGDYAQGLALFERVGQIPNDAVTAYALALQETGQTAMAVQVLATRLATANLSASQAVQIRSALAVAYHANQQPDEAIATLAPLRNDESAILPLARALSAIARRDRNDTLYDEASALYQRALTQTAAPSVGLMTEVADVLSESPAYRAEALRLYRQLAEEQPTASLTVKTAVAAWQLGELSRSQLQQQLRAATQPLPDAPIEQRLLANALIRLDPPDSSLLPIYQDLVDAGVDAPFLHVRIAQIYAERREYDLARQALAVYAASDRGSTDPLVDLLLADLDRREGNWQASVDRYTTLIDQAASPTTVNDALEGLAGVRIAQNQLDEALLVYEQLLRRNPNDPAVRLGWASVAYQTETITQAEAEQVLDQWLATQSLQAPPPSLYRLLAVLPPNPQREAVYEALLAVNSTDVGVNRRLIQVLADRDPTAAQNRVNQLLAANPDDIGAYFIQGEFAQTIGDLDQAIAAYEAILERQPENLDAIAALAGVRFQQRRYAEAVQLYTTVVTAQPNNWEARRALAELSAAQNRPLTALAQLRELQDDLESTGSDHTALEQRIRRLRIDVLRRRGFQPDWERY
ncbi:MAG: tetratricopeptide repeat protein [Synechococcales bacterium]|nr:tetratricopeptide repeat protein [Synechococcales bacterium]